MIHKSQQTPLLCVHGMDVLYSFLLVEEEKTREEPVTPTQTQWDANCIVAHAVAASSFFKPKIS